jgi:Photosynthetic reaction centre cytochrome C subunit
MWRVTVAFIAGWAALGLVESVAAPLGAPPAAPDARAPADPVKEAVGGKARNLKVLPSDIAQADLLQLMTRYSQELGVQCQFCHAEGSQGVDFVSDQSPAKQTARVMIGMLRDINTKYLAQVSDQRYSIPISCGNCHQGQTTPPAYEAKP